MIYDNIDVVNSIKEFITEKRKEKNIVNIILQDNIFELLNMDCKLLYYPLEDTIKGIHIEKIISGKEYQFVYINTKKKVEEQTWTAAHELGHVWKVDRYVHSRVPDCEERIEDIVNRFAAELLMPEEEFQNAFKYARKKINPNNSISLQEFIRIVSYLMNTFCVPYKAVIRRLIELDYVSQDNEEKYIAAFENNKKYYKQTIVENYYTKLDLTRESCSIEDIQMDIDLLEKNNLVKDKVIKKYRDAFKIKEKIVSDETFEVGGHDENE